MPLPDYGSPHVLQENVEDGIIITDVSTQNDGVNAENNLKPQNLMAELANSGVKYNLNDVVMVTKTEDGTLLWLETGNSETGLIHIQNGHADNFAKRGVEDIPQALNTILKETPTLIVTNSRGIYADYMINGKEYRVTYGTNGYIVSFYPI